MAKKLTVLREQLLPKVPLSSTLGKALEYAVKNLPLIGNYLEHACTSLDNNAVENAIRPFAIGRKNWLFSGNEKGARASALFYSLIQTAKKNSLNTYNYLIFIFQNLPNTRTDEDYAKLLPFNLTSEEISVQK